MPDKPSHTEEGREIGFPAAMRSAAEDDQGRSGGTTVSANGSSFLGLLSVGLAVCGRDCRGSLSNVVSKAALAVLVDGGLGAPALTMDVMLPVTEWPARIVDRLLDVSDEMVERGRGINSIVSEKPTRALGTPSKEVVPRCLGGVDESTRGIVPAAVVPVFSEGD